jgi:hypothetical protein
MRGLLTSMPHGSSPWAEGPRRWFFGDPRSGRELLEHVIGDEALIDAAQSVGKSLEHAF